MPTKKQKRSDERYMVNVTIGYDENGKRIRKYFYGDTQKEAKRKRDAFLQEQQLAKDAEIMTIGKWGSTWVKTYATGGYRNKLNKGSNINRLIDYLGENRRLIDIKQADVQEYAKTQSTFTKSHVDKVRRDLTSMFKAAIENDYILKNPCDGVNWEYVKTGSHDVLESYLVDLITRNWQIHPAGIWAMFMLYAGLRPSEVFALKRENITDEFISISDGSHFEYGQLVVVPGQVKSEAGQREIPVTEPLRAVLSAIPDQGLVCLSARGDPVSQAACRANWKTFWNMLEDVHNGHAPQGAGRRTDRLPENWKHLPHVQMYDLRHTYGGAAAAPQLHGCGRRPRDGGRASHHRPAAARGGAPEGASSEPRCAV